MASERVDQHTRPFSERTLARVEDQRPGADPEALANARGLGGVRTRSRRRQRVDDVAPGCRHKALGKDRQDAVAHADDPVDLLQGPPRPLVITPGPAQAQATKGAPQALPFRLVLTQIERHTAADVLLGRAIERRPRLEERAGAERAQQPHVPYRDEHRQPAALRGSYGRDQRSRVLSVDQVGALLPRQPRNVAGEGPTEERVASDSPAGFLGAGRHPHGRGHAMDGHAVVLFPGRGAVVGRHHDHATPVTGQRARPGRVRPLGAARSEGRVVLRGEQDRLDHAALTACAPPAR